MPKAAKRLKDGVGRIYAEFLTRKLPLIFLSLTLFAGGIALLALRIPGWGLILGLPAVQAGIVFLIFVFDDIIRGKIDSEKYRIIHCEICGKPILSGSWEEEEGICRECQRKIIEEHKSAHITS